MFKAIDVANWFIDKFDKDSGDVITHLKLQKLLYYAEAWTQVILDRSLIEENFEAWAHGPVVREVYNQFSHRGWNPLSPTDKPPVFDDDIENVLSDIMETYGEASAKTLENMTHQDRPWIEARHGLPPEARCNTVMTKESIKTFFLEKYSDQLNG
ncbi:Panacea domain-containing protein [Marinobacter shengliensis]|uniref:Panacea domain-containing protein n=1 Tax=Marinobacter shengliensis TaxID=1389223 RepID=UPI001109AE87|nr:type II toxin-antitoxin system antitoxin SocA domain-containing protein [Marinobacter shengliensis]|eukprot:TRINITY_DN51426_c0_g1_i1.p1 TRINITY_DN51426_c0_g1~~TRINITY_DN51426_c0_g1_i1.p1  ORF type:complete len:155 (-),score=20.95 TRINITY_DN51426_c0_g1_i1:207-671(-)